MIAIFAAAVAYVTLFLVGAAMLVRLMRRASSASRHLVWTTSIAASILAPLLLFFGTLGAFQSLGLVRPLIEIDWPFSLPPLPFPTRTFILNAWGIGAGVALLRALLGSAVVRWRALRSPHLRDSQWRELEDAMAGILGMRRTVSLRSGTGGVPFTIGVLQPAILLPATASEWTPDRARLVLLHELAHVARYDAATQLLERMAIALFWFHPLMWVAVRAARRERERACDDLVVARSGSPVPYAAALLALAAEGNPSQRGELAIESGDVESRITAILDPDTPRHPLRLRDAIGAFLFTCSLGFTALVFGAGPASQLASACEAGSEPSLAALRQTGAYHRIKRLHGCTEILAFGGAELDPQGAIARIPPHGGVVVQTVMPELTNRLEIVSGRTTCRTNRRPAPAAECAAMLEDALYAFRRQQELLAR